jgi:hypothetical protein
MILLLLAAKKDAIMFLVTSFHGEDAPIMRIASSKMLSDAHPLLAVVIIII